MNEIFKIRCKSFLLQLPVALIAESCPVMFAFSLSLPHSSQLSESSFAKVKIGNGNRKAVKSLCKLFKTCF